MKECQCLVLVNSYKPIILNTKYNNNKFNFKVNLGDQQKGAAAKGFGPKLTTKPNHKLPQDLLEMDRKKHDQASKGLKKYSQGYTMNKLAKESGSKVDSYVKLTNKSKSKLKRPNNSKKRRNGSNEKQNAGSGQNKSDIGNSIGLYNGNYGDRNS